MTAERELGRAPVANLELDRLADRDGWAHRTWTAEGYHDLCAMLLPAGERTTVQFALAENGFPERAAPLNGAIRPGRYRFLMLGTTPSLGVEFTVTDADQ